MAQQTAVEQLIEWIDSDCSPMDCIMKAKELLKVEKEQILGAYFQGSIDDGPNQNNAEQYYNETYGK